MGTGWYRMENQTGMTQTRAERLLLRGTNEEQGDLLFVCVRVKRAVGSGINLYRAVHLC